MALKRIQKELDDFNKNPPMNITVGVLDENNLFICHAAIIGPNNSPYVFIICVYFPYTYPFDPQVAFASLRSTTQTLTVMEVSVLIFLLMTNGIPN